MEIVDSVVTRELASFDFHFRHTKIYFSTLIVNNKQFDQKNMLESAYLNYPPMWTYLFIIVKWSSDGMFETVPKTTSTKRAVHFPYWRL